jgi:hypothetical protein
MRPAVVTAFALAAVLAACAASSPESRDPTGDDTGETGAPDALTDTAPGDASPSDANGDPDAVPDVVADAADGDARDAADEGDIADPPDDADIAEADTADDTDPLDADADDTADDTADAADVAEVDTGASDTETSDTDATDVAEVDAADVCVPSCAGLACGDDGCGGSCGTCAGRLACDAGACVDPYPGLPFVHNLSGMSTERVRALVTEALAGMGLDATTGPVTDDRVVVTRHYVAWLDQTGFYGKMNGLWWLDGTGDDTADFVLRAPGGRPVNTFVVGERGDGAWPAGYPGAEHLEFPNRTPEPNDNPGCASGDWCNQYSVDEAAAITDPDIPWWSACNAGDRAWSALAEPVENEVRDGALRLVWEAPLVKEADGDSNRDGDACHQDWLFADGVRRRVWLRMGFEFHPDEPWIDRVVQFRNPEGNPAFDAPMSLIGGFVITGWPDAYPLKALHRAVRLSTRTIDDPYRGGQLMAGLWRAWPDTPIGRDIVFGWVRDTFALSPWEAFVHGVTIELSHVGESDNDDTGLCLCEVHGGTEMGGGLLHGGISLPIAGGALSVEGRRRIRMGGDDWRPLFRRILDAASLSHGTGRAEGSSWRADPGDAPAHMIYGPYASDLPADRVVVTFDLATGGPTSARVANLDVYDATSDEVLAARAVTGTELPVAGTARMFALTADLRGRAGHVIESRVWFDAVVSVRVDRVGFYGPGSAE